MLKFIEENWRNVIEILILAICIYQVYRAFRATRGAPVSYTHLTLPTILRV